MLLLPHHSLAYSPIENTLKGAHQQSERILYLITTTYRKDTQKADLTALIAWLANFVSEDGIEKRLKDQLVIVSDDLFAHIAQFATPVTPHIAIDNATKTVKPGALWYEETLPPETVLYLTLATSRTRRKGADIDAATLMTHTLSLFPAERAYLQLGGNETTGMGWCRVARVEA